MSCMGDEASVKALCDQYYIGVPAAEFLLKSHQKFIEYEFVLQQQVESRAFPKIFSPSASELENAVACLYDFVASMNEKLLCARALVRQYYPKVAVPEEQDLVESSFEAGDDMIFMSVYALERVQRKMEEVGDANNDQDAGETDTLCEMSSDEKFSNHSLVVDNLYSGQGLFDVVKGDAMDSALTEYVQEHWGKIDACIDGFPYSLKRSIVEDVQGVLMRHIEKYGEGEYTNGLEHRFLEKLEEIGTPQYDELYARLKAEKKLGDVGLQKVYLGRFIARKKVHNFEELRENIADTFFCDSRNRRQSRR